jgi:hypothetical protein
MSLKMSDVRFDLLDEVRKFFVGPRTEGDPLPEGNTPLDMYTSGILFPMEAPLEDVDKDENGSDSSDNDDSSTEDESQKFLKPNSIGLRVQLNDSVKKISVEIDYGKYFKNGDDIWERTSLDDKSKTHQIDLSKQNGEIEIFNEVKKLESKISWMLHSDYVLNIFLENPTYWVVPEPDVKEKDKKNSISYDEAQRLNNSFCIFQPTLSINSVNSESAFEPISTTSKFYSSPEDDLFDMLYKNKKVFGVGYGCAAEWDDGGKPASIRTTILPTFQDDEIAKFSDVPDSEKPSRVDMYDLGCFDSLEDNASNRKKIHSQLSPMITQYGKWIEKQKEIVDKNLVGDKYESLANENLEKCSQSHKRMISGLNLLTDEKMDPDNKILKSFILANRAMLYQRIHFSYALKNFKGQEKQEWPSPKHGLGLWYPFQIAFLLMSIPGISDKTHDDNHTVDLIWFPTGGGKTEAYLGVASFAMILRRLKGDVEDGLGVSVIMRYTLRLLTLQQFERASTLICALEYLRRKVKGSGLGTEPFLLGLWVGYSLTPNLYESSEESLKKLRDNPRITPADGSPCQTNYCPWCGTRMNPYNYKFDPKTKWTLARCSNDTSPCIFTDPNFSPQNILPVVTVDSDIYTRCPSMIIATVDKFARLPFRPEIANIFGRAARRCGLHGFLPDSKYKSCGIENEGSHRGSDGKVRYVDSTFPPDLIIQDELHLISGPLGTMVGLYESAVDFLTQKNIDGKSTGLKVIASTATIKGAKDQVRKIFNKSNTDSFPPPGIDRSDSFFWWETGKKGKMFVGLSFSQRSGKYALGKLYAALLQKIHLIRQSENIKDDDVDPYWTLVGYYNSIRELGGANRLVEDDVVMNMRFLADAIYGNKKDVRDPGTPENGIDELTGRKTQREINEIRDKLEKSLPDKDVISVLLATNMISVGIDIDRLALMTVNGQPKSATEYIQATGRIGRRPESPGSVFVLFNPYKPRDLSHYENFAGFHNTMQKHVEPSSLTPFSIPAYTRGIHAVFISMMRLSNSFLAEKKSANNFTIADGKLATKFLLDRFKTVELTDDDSSSFKDFKTKIVTFQEEWEKFIRDVEDDSSLVETVWYNNPYDKWHGDKEKNPSVLMIEFAKRGKQESDQFPISTPESFRDVEQQIEMEYV